MLNPPIVSESCQIPHCSTFIDLVRHRASGQPNQTSHLFLERGETPGAEFTYGEIDRWACQIGRHLQSCLPVGERVLLIFPQSPDFCAAFLGCLYAGMVAVPVNPPQNPRYMSRLWAIVQETQAALILTDQNLLQRLRTHSSTPDELTSTLHWVVLADILAGTSPLETLPALASDTTAFLQFTSGSTATPKGVMVSHGNLLNNLQGLQTSFLNPVEGCLVNWLPFFHDWGLIGGLLLPIYTGLPCVTFDPISFLQKPLRWLQAISRFQGTVSGGPNFAYDLCLRNLPSVTAAVKCSFWVWLRNPTDKGKCRLGRAWWLASMKRLSIFRFRQEKSIPLKRQ